MFAVCSAGGSPAGKHLLPILQYARFCSRSVDQLHRNIWPAGRRRYKYSMQ